MSGTVEHELTRVSQDLIVIRTFGQASVAGFATVFDDIASQPEIAPGLKLLSDHTDLDVSALSAGDIARIAELGTMFTKPLGPAAIVVGSSATLRFGLARMFEGYASPESGNEIRVFENFNAAMAWIKACDQDL